MADHPSVVPITPRDAVMAGTWIVILFRHLSLPSRSELVDALERIARADPLRRVVARAGDHAWDVVGDPNLRDRCEEGILELPAHAADDPDALLASVRAMAPCGPPVLFVTAGDVLVQLVDHRLCDGLFASQLAPLLLAECGGRPVPSPFAASQSTHPLRDAVRRTFGSVSAVRALFRDRREDGARRPAPAEPQPPHPPTSPRAAGQVSRYVQIAPDRYTALRRWQRTADAAPVVAEGALVRTALVDEGIACDDDMTVLVDLRRYLPEGGHTLGNFVVGQPIPVAGVPAMSARLREALTVGRPLAASVAGMLSATLTGFIPRPPAEQGTAAGAAFAVSSMGLLRGFERLPWTVPADRQMICVYVDTGSPRGVTALTLVANGVLHVTVTFDPSHIATDRVEAALERVAADPVSLLGGARVG